MNRLGINFTIKCTKELKDGETDMLRNAGASLWINVPSDLNQFQIQDPLASNLKNQCFPINNKS